MSEEVKAKRQRHQDRVTLDPECLQKIDSWIGQVTTVAKGVMLSRKDIVNWMVTQHAEALSAEELGDLKARYFSEVRFLQQAIKELKAAKQRGESITLDQILSSAAPGRKRVTGRRRKSEQNPKDAPQGNAALLESPKD